MQIEWPNVPPKHVRGNSNAHWRVRSKWRRMMRESGNFYYQSARGQHHDKVRLTFDFHYGYKVDLDNLAYGLKSFVDGMVDAGMVDDDSPDHVVYGQHSFTKTPRGEDNYKTIITIEEVA